MKCVVHMPSNRLTASDSGCSLYPMILSSTSLPPCNHEVGAALQCKVTRLSSVQPSWEPNHAGHPHQAL
jgi:hypothetical protein